MTSSARSRTTRATALTGAREPSCLTFLRSARPSATTSGSTSSFVSDPMQRRQDCCPDLQDHNLANTLIDEFPCRPHWTKNTREVFARSVKNLDPSVSAPKVAYRRFSDSSSISPASRPSESGSIPRASTGVLLERFWASISDEPIRTC